MKTKYKFIYFEKMNDHPLSMWIIRNSKTDGTLGYLEYYKPWKQYIFFSIEDAAFNDSRLKDVIHFMGQLKRG